MREKFVYLPTPVSNPPEITSDAPKETYLQGKYPCSCCKYITFPVPPNEAVAYICPVCYWENDVFISNDNEASDENHGMTLNEARRNFKQFGACSADMLKYVRKPMPEETPK